MNEIRDDILDLPVVGLNLLPGRLRDQLGDRPTVVAFLRHLG